MSSSAHRHLQVDAVEPQGPLHPGHRLLPVQRVWLPSGIGGSRIGPNVQSDSGKLRFIRLTPGIIETRFCMVFEKCSHEVQWLS